MPWRLKWYTTTVFWFSDSGLCMINDWSKGHFLGVKEESYSLSMVARARRASEVLCRTVNDEAYLSIKELLYASQTLLPVDT